VRAAAAALRVGLLLLLGCHREVKQEIEVHGEEHRTDAATTSLEQTADATQDVHIQADPTVEVTVERTVTEAVPATPEHAAVPRQVVVKKTTVTHGKVVSVTQAHEEAKTEAHEAEHVEDVAVVQAHEQKATETGVDWKLYAWGAGLVSFLIVAGLLYFKVVKL
jgi:hypothetical protein